MESYFVKMIFQCALIAILVAVYEKIVKFEDINIDFNNGRKSKALALIAVLISIIMTAIYNKYFMSIFPINTLINLFIVRLVLVIPAIVCIIINKEGISNLGFTKKNFFKSIFLGFLIGVIYFLSYKKMSLYDISNIVLQFKGTLIFLFVYCLIIGVSEEFLYRGYLQTRLIAVNGKINGWIIASIIFAFMHFPQKIVVNKFGLVQATLSCAELLPISLLLGYISIKNKNIISNIIFHGCIDFTSFIFML